MTNHAWPVLEATGPLFDPVVEPAPVGADDPVVVAVAVELAVAVVDVLGLQRLRNHDWIWVRPCGSCGHALGQTPVALE